MGVQHLADIEAGLLGWLTTATFSTPMAVAIPGRTFTPPASGCYLRAAFFPNGPYFAPISDDDDAGAIGQMLVQVRWRADDGEVRALRIAGEVGQRFKRGTRVPGVVPIRIDREPVVAGSITETGGGILVPVTVYWTYSGD